MMMEWDKGKNAANDSFVKVSASNVRNRVIGFQKHFARSVPLNLLSQLRHTTTEQNSRHSTLMAVQYVPAVARRSSHSYRLITLEAAAQLIAKCLEKVMAIAAAVAGVFMGGSRKMAIHQGLEYCAGIVTALSANSATALTNGSV